MKKIFSLICLFTFVFFGVANTVLASTDPENTLTIEEVRVAFETYLKQKPDGETGINFNVKEVKCDAMTENKCDDSATELIVVLNDAEGTNYIFDYNKTENSLSYSNQAEALVITLSDAMYVDALCATIAQLHGFTYSQWADFFKLVGKQEFTYEDDGFEYSLTNLNGEEFTEAEVLFDFKISLKSDFKNTLTSVLSSNTGGEDSGSNNGSDDSGNGNTGNDDGSDDSGNTSGGTDNSGNTGAENTGTGTTEKPENNASTADISVGNLLFIGGCLLLITGYGVVKLKKIK